MKKYKETGKIFCKIMNKPKKGENSTHNSESEHQSSYIENGDNQRPVEMPQAIYAA